MPLADHDPVLGWARLSNCDDFHGRPEPRRLKRAARDQSIEPSAIKNPDMFSTIYCVCGRFHGAGYTICRIASLPFWQLLTQPLVPLSNRGLSWCWLGMRSNNGVPSSYGSSVLLVSLARLVRLVILTSERARMASSSISVNSPFEVSASRRALTGQPEVPSETTRDHLFISYAGEDHTFARWLALRLTAEGYKVWIDQFEMLGGESWPRVIDIAIKTRTFRMLGLLSKHSIAKPNPLKERTLALNIAKQPGMERFLVPINVDGLTSVELDWLTSDITFVPFATSWHKGLVQLLKLLEREHCPRDVREGRAIVSRLVCSSEMVSDTPELLTSNRCVFSRVPECIKGYRISPALKRENGSLRAVLRDWSVYSVSPNLVLAFHPPPKDLARWFRANVLQSYDWINNDVIEGIDSRNVVVSLLRGCIETRLQRAGFEWSAAAEAYVFPGPQGQRIRVTLPSGKTTTVQQSGERTFFRVGQSKIPYRYRLAVNLMIDRIGADEFGLTWRLGFHLTDTGDEPLPSSQHLSRRKHITRCWHNYHWLVRYLAAMQSCADDNELIRVGPDDEQQVVLDCRPAAFEVDKSLNEEKLGALRDVSDEDADAVPVSDDSRDDSSDQRDNGDE